MYVVIDDNGNLTCNFTLKSLSEHREMSFRSSSPSVDCSVHDPNCIKQLQNNEFIRGNCSQEGSGLIVLTTCEITSSFVGNVCCIIRSDTTGTSENCTSFPLPSSK